MEHVFIFVLHGSSQQQQCVTQLRRTWFLLFLLWTVRPASRVFTLPFRYFIFSTGVQTWLCCMLSYSPRTGASEKELPLINFTEQLMSKGQCWFANHFFCCIDPIWSNDDIIYFFTLWLYNLDAKKVNKYMYSGNASLLKKHSGNIWDQPKYFFIQAIMQRPLIV